MAKSRKSRYGNFPGAGKPGAFSRCKTVGELKKALADVPDDLPLNGDDGLRPIWYNVGEGGRGVNQEHMNFEPDPEMDDF